MGSVLGKWFASLFIASCVFAVDEWSGAFHATLQGKLVKKHFSAPRVVKDPPFGWFVELDALSQEIISKLFHRLSATERKLYRNLNLQYIRLLADQFAIREWAHNHCNDQVTIEGEILEPCLLSRELSAFNFIPEIVSPEITEEEKALAGRHLEEIHWEPTSFDWSEDNDDSLVLPDDEPERLVLMRGTLHLEIRNGNLNFDEIESGGHPAYCWMLKLDPQSFEIACTTPVRACFQTPASIRSCKNGDQLWLTGDFDPEWLCDRIGQVITVQGYLWHAHTAHHPTPLMLDTDPWLKLKKVGF